ncbi:methylmalonyl Co-A mutase-associated GTPase MeaB [Halovenus marina]|uniref:methylmalonyl Co-A mutase-associated GTPase MeaB n=1 Tax=Halovenus marina TaxID=3396621 RepID=UPI003F54D7FF
MSDLVSELLAGDHRALARVITNIENREDGYRDVVARLHPHTGDARVIGVTGSPGSGKSTLVDRLASAYREQGLTVGVIAIDPSSPFTGGAVLGDRIRMASNVGDMEVFVRSMSARGSLGGLSTATTDAVRALDAFGKDRIIIETVGAGQNEIDIVKTADTVAVLVPPGSGDDVQMLKAGILEIGDLFVVNKADLSGADRTVRELHEMLEYGREAPEAVADEDSAAESEWHPPVIETVATEGTGIEDVLDTLDSHSEYLLRSGRDEELRRRRYREEIQTLLREDINGLLAEEIDSRGGLDQFVDRVCAGETDPYTVADELLEPVADCMTSENADE